MSEGENNVVEAFNIAHTTVVEQLSDLSFIPRSFNPRLEDRKSTKSKRMSTSGAFIPVSTLVYGVIRRTVANFQNIFYSRPAELREGNVFSCVYLSVCPWWRLAGDRYQRCTGPHQ